MTGGGISFRGFTDILCCSATARSLTDLEKTRSTPAAVSKPAQEPQETSELCQCKDIFLYHNNGFFF